MYGRCLAEYREFSGLGSGEVRSLIDSGLNRLKPWAFIFATLLLVLPGGAFAQSTRPANGSAPDVIAKQFYTWYLQLLTKDKNPMKDEPGELSKYVSQELIREVKKKIDSPNGLGADYFIQAQDYLEDWPDNVSAETANVNGQKATTIVTLGGRTSPRYRLTLTLARNGDAWKISGVARK